MASDGEPRLGARSLAAGASLGAFVGMLLGLAVDPVAKSVMTTALALVAALFGLAGKGGRLVEPPSDGRLLAFCLAAIVATLLALTARTHDWLSPPDAAGAGSAGRSGATASYRATVLFSAPAGDCADIARLQDRPLAEQLAHLRSAGGAEAALAQRIAGLPEPDRPQALASGVLLLCGG